MNSNKAEQHVPYRRMPFGYLATWIALNALVMLYREIQSYGWPPGNYGELVSSVVIGGLFGGFVWGWVFWKFWLYKKFPVKPMI